MEKLIITKKGKYYAPFTNEDYESLLYSFENNNSDNSGKLRDYRNSLLSETDWVVTKSVESQVGVSTEWIEYRQALRDLPAHERAPDKFLESDWPLMPGSSTIPTGAEIFIPSISDPLGIGTTSWIGITSTGEYYFQERPQPPSEEPPVEE